MTYQKVNIVIDDITWTYNGKSITKEDMIKCREISHKALEKQIPQKPYQETVNRGISVSGEYDIDFNCLCPNCNTVVGDYETGDAFYKFCPDCGQRIDWSEMDE